MSVKVPAQETAPEDAAPHAFLHVNSSALIVAGKHVLIVAAQLVARVAMEPAPSSVFLVVPVLAHPTAPPDVRDNAQAVACTLVNRLAVVHVAVHVKDRVDSPAGQCAAPAVA